MVVGSVRMSEIAFGGGKETVLESEVDGHYERVAFYMVEYISLNY